MAEPLTFEEMKWERLEGGKARVTVEADLATVYELLRRSGNALVSDPQRKWGGPNDLTIAHD